MTNIKISELDELQKATDQDLLVIVDVDNNKTKKIQAGNLGILVPKTEKTTSDTETYSCNYVNGIVESGSNNYGNWIKFEDGTMICTRTITVTIDCTNSWGSLYYGQNYDKFNFAQSFIEPPILSLQYSAHGNLSFIPIAYSEIVIDKDGFKGIDIARPASATNVYVKVYFIAIGKWK